MFSRQLQSELHITGYSYSRTLISASNIHPSPASISFRFSSDFRLSFGLVLLVLYLLGADLFVFLPLFRFALLLLYSSI